MPVRVLMVCLGNICRSPLAEGILAHLTDPATCAVDSAGTAGYHVGHPPDPRSIEVAATHGIDISRQRCRRFEPTDFERFDYIFAMDRENLANIRRLARNRDEIQKASLLLEAAGIGTLDVPDPYYGGAEGFEEVYGLILRACEQIRQNLIRN